tara:strand:- start:605 stop:1753 length:1149 start_codon:yes stop_codon:yes gene_type:complete
MANDNDEQNFLSNFNATRYFKNEKVSVGNTSMYVVDGSDAFANGRKMFISFQHAPTGKSVFFKAFITAFNEAYNSDWAAETVYGRADPIYLFKNTQRKITLAFKIPAYSQSEAYENLGKVQKLIQFMYPNYTDVQGAQTISQSPLIRLKVMNLLRNTNDRFSHMDRDYGYSATSSSQMAQTSDELGRYSKLQTWQSHDGLLGALDYVNVNHNLEGDDGSFVVGENALLPKLLDVNLSFSPIHEHPLGWDETDTFSAHPGTTKNSRAGQQRLFPYGVGLKDEGEVTNKNIHNSATGQSVVSQIKADEQSGRETSDGLLANAAAKIKSVTDGLFNKETVSETEAVSTPIDDLNRFAELDEIGDRVASFSAFRAGEGEFTKSEED